MPASRRRAVLAAIHPTARVAHLGSAALTVVLAAVPTLAIVAGGGADVTGSLVFAGVLGGATLGWTGEDRAAELLTPLPVPTPVRTALRAVCVTGVVVGGLALIALIVVLSPGLPRDQAEHAGHLVVAAAAAAVALATANVAARRGEHSSGLVAVTIGALTPGAVATAALRWPTVLPTFTAGSTHGRWWILAAIALAVAVHTARDPGRP